MTQQYHFSLPQQEAMTVEDFLPASSNEEAVTWLLQRGPQDWPSHALVLCGPTGSGKTHLLSIWSEQNQALRVKAGDPMLAQIVQGSCSVKAFAIDNADEIAGKPEQEEWLQHFYNATASAGASVLLTAKEPPAAWGLTLRDIETRLKSCQTVRLHEPDDALILGLLLKLFRDRQLMVEAGVVEYLAARVDRTGTAVRNIVAQLDEAALQSGRKISIPFAQKILFPARDA